MGVEVGTMRGIISAAVILVALTVNVPTTAIEPAIPAPIQEPSRGERVLMMEATAYCYTGNRTYTGTWPQEGRTIAVDPEIIPLNSEVYVSCESWPEVNGWYIAEDTGGVIKGNIIDVYMQDYDTCIQFGRRQVEVRVLGVRQ
jgi:3D (Asp-Asp-Asp) domain-containing protein